MQMRPFNRELVSGINLSDTKLLGTAAGSKMLGVYRIYAAENTRQFLILGIRF